MAKITPCIFVSLFIVEPLPTTGLPPEPCSVSLCEFGQCVNVNGTATCVCKHRCLLIEQPVCGSDNRTYANLCAMEAESCERKEHLSVQYDGPCGKYYIRPLGRTVKKW